MRELILWSLTATSIIIYVGTIIKEAGVAYITPDRVKKIYYNSPNKFVFYMRFTGSFLLFMMFTVICLFFVPIIYLGNIIRGIGKEAEK